MQDTRFSFAKHDARFKKISAKSKKVVMDERFESLLSEESKPKFEVDEFGRKLNPKLGNDLSEFYTTSETDNAKEKKKQNESNKDQAKQEQKQKSKQKQSKGNKKRNADKKKEKENETNNKEEEKNKEEKEEDVHVNNEEENEKDDENKEEEEKKEEEFDENEPVVAEESDSDGGSTDEELEEYLAKKQAEDEEEADNEEEEDIPTGEVTNRFAIVNIDWKEIKAVDLYATLSSFVPNGGVLESVAIYVSDYGKKKMEEEAQNGPPEWIWSKKGETITFEDTQKEADAEKESDINNSNKKEQKEQETKEQNEESNEEEENENDAEEEDAEDNEIEEQSETNDDNESKEESDEDEDNDGEEKEEEDDDDDVEDDESDKEGEQSSSLLESHYTADCGFDAEALRRYEIDRMRYYFAIATFDSIKSAVAVAEACDGMEIEKTANTFDIRFVADGESFADNEMTDVCRSMPLSYQPLKFYSKAKYDTNLTLSWDENSNERKRILNRDPTKITDENEDEYLQFLAGSESDTDSDSELEKPDENGHYVGFAVPKAKQTGKTEEEERELRKERLRKKREQIKKKYAALLHPTDDTSGVDKEITFTPGLAEKGAELAEKIAEEKNEGETTMWEKYQQRRKEKQREKRNEKRKAARAKKQGGASSSDDESSDNGDADDSVITLQPNAKEEKARAERKRARAAAKAAQAAHDRAELELVMLDENEDHALALKDTEKEGEQEKKTSKEKRKEFKKKLRESRKTKAKRKQQEKAEAEAEASKLIAGADDRFTEIFTSSEFAPDPTNPEFKKTVGIQAVLKEREKRQKMKKEKTLDEMKEEDEEEKKNGAGKRKGNEISDLVNSLKKRKANK